MDALKVGDKIIYPNHGLGVVEAVREERFDGQFTKIFHVRILANDTLVMIPSASADEIGIRRPVTESTMRKLIQFIKSSDVDITTDWKGRYKENISLMKSGTLFDMALVLKGLYCLSQVKPLSFREKKMLEKVKDLIVTELSEATDLPSSKIEGRIREALSQAAKNFKPEVAT
jgi:CarD family transcriptional regulator